VELIVKCCSDVVCGYQVDVFWWRWWFSSRVLCWSAHVTRHRNATRTTRTIATAGQRHCWAQFIYTLHVTA